MSADITDRVTELEKHKERVEIRLDGGAKAFDAVRKELDRLVERTTPKALPIWQTIVAAFGILGTILGVWWTFRGELDSKANAADVEAVRSAVTEQRILLTNVKNTSDNTAQVLGEMKADVKADIAELKIDIRAIGASAKGR